jgi:hypothetical protein
MQNKIIVTLLSFCLLLLTYITYYQTVYVPARLSMCHDTAVELERLRHPSGDLEVTNNDLAQYNKSMVTCFIGR